MIPQMSGPEKKVENQIKSYLDLLGAYYLKVHGSMYQPAGTPDILACINGRFVAIEVKRPNGGVVSALSIVARSVEDVSEMLQQRNVI
jgi:RecB family endonuclease NucS